MNRSNRRMIAKAIVKSRVPLKVAQRYNSRLDYYKQQDLEQLNMLLTEIVSGRGKVSKTDLNALKDAIEFLNKQENEKVTDTNSN